MPRKTLEVRDLMSWINGALASPSLSSDERAGLIGVGAKILHATGNYKGFEYINPGGDRVPTKDVQAGNYDPNRIRFYLTGIPE